LRDAVTCKIPSLAGAASIAPLEAGAASLAPLEARATLHECDGNREQADEY
jgi:hypothetical protein